MVTDGGGGRGSPLIAADPRGVRHSWRYVAERTAQSHQPGRRGRPRRRQEPVRIGAQRRLRLVRGARVPEAIEDAACKRNSARRVSRIDRSPDSSIPIASEAPAGPTERAACVDKGKSRSARLLVVRSRSSDIAPSSASTAPTRSRLRVRSRQVLLRKDRNAIALRMFGGTKSEGDRNERHRRVPEEQRGLCRGL
jgi:hypothetical protein